MILKSELRLVEIVEKELADPFIIKCVKCKHEFDETVGTYRRICPQCIIQEKEDRRKKISKERNENKVLEHVINCKYCKNDFLAKSKQRMYCSDTCRTKYHNVPDDIQRTEDRIDRLVLKLEHFRSLID